MEISIYLSLYDSNFSKHFNFCLKLIRRYVDGDRYLSFSSVAQIFSKILFLVLMEHDVIQEFRILFEQNLPKNFNFYPKLIECYLNREFRMIRDKFILLEYFYLSISNMDSNFPKNFISRLE